jgi:hypothetical protein
MNARARSSPSAPPAPDEQQDQLHIWEDEGGASAPRLPVDGASCPIVRGSGEIAEHDARGDQ